MAAAVGGSALITGAARRIGRAIALDLARAGWPGAVHYNSSAEEANAVVAEIRTAGGRAVALAADLADAGAVQRLVPATAAALGPLACLVNNASLFEIDTVATATACHDPPPRPAGVGTSG